MDEKRRDNRNRVLRNGESQRKDGRYLYKYVDGRGHSKYLYSWKLVASDPLPKGKKDGLSLRELEKIVAKEEEYVMIPYGSDYTVLDLVQKYIDQKQNVRESTKIGYRTVLNILKKEDFAYKQINKVKHSDAKRFLMKLQVEDKRGYSTIHNVRGVLRPAFTMAYEDDLIKKNPFDFKLCDVVMNDSISREALTKDQERKFIKFFKEDKHFKKYYEGIYILFKTGLRISEFCALTLDDIDLKNRTINVNKQLQYKGSTKYRIEECKTKSGKRVIPIPKNDTELYRCLEFLVKKDRPRVEPTVDGVKGFLYFSRNKKPLVAYQWTKMMKFAVDKYNNTYKKVLPNVTPHVCRHTYCTNMIKAGVNPKTVQVLMGHAGIEITMDIYTHLQLEDVVKEVNKLAIC